MIDPRATRPPDPTLEHPFELLLVLEALYEALQFAQGWSGCTALLTVELPERVLVGADYTRLWLEPASKEHKLRGLDVRKLLTRDAGARPTLLLEAPIWRFGYRSPGAVGSLRQLEDRAPEREAVLAAVRTTLGELDAFRRRVAEATLGLGDAPAWMRCLICSPLPALSFSPPTGEAPAPTTVPVRSNYLEVLGEPVFTAYPSSRDWCVRRCPLCATHYLLRSDYEYLVNGASESETSFTRLEPPLLQPWLDLVATGVRLGTAPRPLERP